MKKRLLDGCSVVGITNFSGEVEKKQMGLVEFEGETTFWVFGRRFMLFLVVVRSELVLL